MHGWPKSGSLFTPNANDVADAGRHVNQTFLGSFFVSKKHHDFLNISQNTVRNLFDLQLLKIRPKRRYFSCVATNQNRIKKWWADSMECCCHLRNVQDLLADGKTPP